MVQTPTVNGWKVQVMSFDFSSMWGAGRIEYRTEQIGWFINAGRWLVRVVK
jgi:hypothetical protein